jgi:hypothetical protein
MRECPKCHSLEMHRSRARSLRDRFLVWLRGANPYRCRSCGYRGWGGVGRSRPISTDWVPANHPPDLQQVDAALDRFREAEKPRLASEPVTTSTARDRAIGHGEPSGA